MKLICIEQKYRNKYLLNNLVKIWESSVRATHLFLSDEDIQNLIPKVIDGIKNIKKLIIITNKNNINCAFMGISENKIEMLFVGSDFRGQGIGKKLINYAINTLNVLYVDVNEQNEQAIGFYKKYGLKLLGRSETDNYGNSFPILHLGMIKK